MAYANVIQVFSDSRIEIIDAVEAKVKASSGDEDRQGFWKEVIGRIYRNNYYTEITSMIHLEKYNSHNIQSSPIIADLVVSPNIVEWIKMIPKFMDEVDFMLDYQKDNFIMEKPSDAQAFEACLGSLQFFNDAIAQGKSLEELFEYIPLLTWSIEALLATRQLHRDFTSFILDSIFPVLRAHRATVLAFLDLVEREDEFTKQAEENKVELARSTIFSDRNYEPEKLNLYIPEDPSKTNPDVQDPYLDTFCRSLLVIFNGGKIMGPRVDQAKRDWYFTPLSMLYRLRMHCEKLGCLDSYIPVISPKVLSTAANNIYAHDKFYCEHNLLESSILAIENVIIEAQTASDGVKPFLVNRFNEILQQLKKDLEDLLGLGLITAQGAGQTLKRVLARGEIYGLYFPNH